MPIKHCIRAVMHVYLAYFFVFAIFGQAGAAEAKSDPALCKALVTSPKHERRDVKQDISGLRKFDETYLHTQADERIQLAFLGKNLKTPAVLLIEKGLPPKTIATMSSQGSGRKSTVALQIPLISANPVQQSEFLLSAIEHLYSWLLLQDRSVRFDLSIGASRPLAPNTSYEKLLLQMIEIRQCAATQVRAVGGVVSRIWDPAEIRPIFPEGIHDHHMQVIIKSSDGKPLPGVTITFERGEHLSCVSKTNKNGLASCELFDGHGHEVHDSGRQITRINFSGALFHDRIYPPRMIAIP
jgi:hypothetical protein